MSATKPPDNRQSVRYTRRIPVRFGTEAKMVGGIAVDISDGGLRVETTDFYPVKSLVTVFVQFPRHAVRLMARVAWVGKEQSLIGLSLTVNSPALKKSYETWLAEVKEAAREDRERTRKEGNAAPESAATEEQASSSPSDRTAPPAPPSRPAPPSGPVRRRIETTRGQAYDVLIEPVAENWYLTIHQVPRQPEVDQPDLQKVFPNYDAVNRALKEFIRTH